MIYFSIALYVTTLVFIMWFMYQISVSSVELQAKINEANKMIQKSIQDSRNSQAKLRRDIAKMDKVKEGLMHGVA